MAKNAAMMNMSTAALSIMDDCGCEGKNEIAVMFIVILYPELPPAQMRPTCNGPKDVG